MSEELEDRRRNGWTLWREIYGTVIGALAVVIPVAIWMGGYLTDHDRKITNHEARVQRLEQSDNEQEGRILEKGRQLDTRLDRMESKLDRLVERRP